VAELALPQPLANLVGASRAVAASDRNVVSGSVARYQVLRRLARGGMADVYLATQTTAEGTEQTVVIKRLRAELRRDPEFGKMFQDEVQIAVRLNHPNVVGVIEPLVAGSETLLVLEWVQGRSLSAILNRARKRDRALPPALVAAIGAQVAAGLQHAHDLRDADGNRMGVIHRDVSPQNIMVSTDGVAKILDFGVAWVLGRMSRTRVGVAKGKLGYMAPEQLEHRAIDQRTDIFALGVVLWEALAGRRLFPLDRDGVAVRASSTPPAEPPSTFRPVPPELDRIVMRALEPEPHRRPRNAAELSAELAEFASTHDADTDLIRATVAELFDGTHVGRAERHRTSATVAIRQPGAAATSEPSGARTPAVETPAARTPALSTSGAFTPPLMTPLPPPSRPRGSTSSPSGPHAPPTPAPTSSSPSLRASQSMPTLASSGFGGVHGLTPAADYASEVSRFPSHPSIVAQAPPARRFAWGVLAGCIGCVALLLGIARLQPALLRPLMAEEPAEVARSVQVGANPVGPVAVPLLAPLPAPAPSARVEVAPMGTPPLPIASAGPSPPSPAAGGPATAPSGDTAAGPVTTPATVAPGAAPAPGITSSTKEARQHTGGTRKAVRPKRPASRPRG